MRKLCFFSFDFLKERLPEDVFVEFLGLCPECGAELSHVDNTQVCVECGLVWDGYGRIE